jgi:hypothetical protein
MIRKIIFPLFLIAYGMFSSLSYAQDFTIKDYTFVWNVAKEGKTHIKVQKDPNGIRILLGAGGSLGTIALPPAVAKEIGETLSKTEDYYNQFENYFKEKQHKKTGRDFSKIENVKDYNVWFYSEAKRKKFQIRISKAKVSKSMANLTKEEALKVRDHLLRAEKMAAYADQKIKP